MGNYLVKSNRLGSMISALGIQARVMLGRLGAFSTRRRMSPQRPRCCWIAALSHLTSPFSIAAPTHHRSFPVCTCSRALSRTRAAASRSIISRARRTFSSICKSTKLVHHPALRPPCLPGTFMHRPQPLTSSRAQIGLSLLGRASTAFT